MTNDPIKCPHCNKIFFSIESNICPFCKKDITKFHSENDIPDFMKDLFGNFNS